MTPPALEQTSQLRASRTGRLVVLAVVVGAVLRLIGLGWGTPNELHLYSYHPDEWSTVEPALRIAFLGDLNPRFFNYPSVHIYLVALVYKLASLPLTADGVIGWAYPLARLVTVTMGVATIWLTACLGTALGGVRCGLAAAWLLAVLPLHVVNSHYATVDVPLTFWATLAIWYATLGIAQERRCERRAAGLAWAGAAVAVGLATGTKYNGALLLPAVWLAAAGATRGRARLALLVALPLLSAVVFVATSPFVFLDPAAWPQVRFELVEHPRHSSIFADVRPGWLFHLSANLPTAAGWLAPLAALGGGLLALRQRRLGWLPLLLWTGLALLSMMRTAELFIRYWLPVLPGLAVCAGLAVEAVGRRSPRWAWLLVLLVAVGPSLRSVAMVRTMAGEDARDEAARWALANIPAGESVGLVGAGESVWFWSVPLRRNNGGVRTLAAGRDERHVLRLDPASWAEAPPDWLLLNLNVVHERYDSQGRPRPWAAGCWEPVGEWRNSVTAWPGHVVGARPSRLHDWLYPLPAIQALRYRPPEADGAGDQSAVPDPVADPFRSPD